MPFQVIPREQVFFELLNESAVNLVGATAELAILAEDLTDAEDRSERIREIEHRGDDLTRAIVQRLDVTFVAPGLHLDVVVVLDQVLQQLRRGSQVARRFGELIEELIRTLADLEPIGGSPAPCSRSHWYHMGPGN